MRKSSELSEPSDNKINQWCDFIKQHLLVLSFITIDENIENMCDSTYDIRPINPRGLSILLSNRL